MWRRFQLEQNIENCEVSCMVEMGNYPAVKRQKKVDFESRFTRTDPAYYGKQAMLLALETVKVLNLVLCKDL